MRIEWTYVDHQRLPGREFRFISRYARGGQRILEERGDRDGWVSYSHAEPPVPMSRFPQLHLHAEDGVWQHAETGAVLQWWPVTPATTTSSAPADAAAALPGADHFRDIRWIGTYAFSAETFQRVPAVFSESRGEWAQRPAADGVEVELRASEKSRIVSLIDPQRDWNPLRITIASGTRLVRSEIQLDQFGDVWFPVHIETVIDDTRFETIAIELAEFNAASDAREFSPVDIGVEAGMNVHRATVGDPESAPEVMAWDGRRAVSRADWIEGEKTGRYRAGPTLRRLRESGGGDNPHLTAEQREQRLALARAAEERARLRAPTTEWERYVRDFIQTHALDDTQTQRALLVLKDCVRQAEGFFVLRAEQLDLQHTRLLGAIARSDAAEIGRERAELERLLAPVDVIFASQLKPRLERLLTRQQRARAGSQPTRP